jgi:hypothetical protein
MFIISLHILENIEKLWFPAAAIWKAPDYLFKYLNKICITDIINDIKSHNKQAHD